ncbi:exopolysaccharide biosynthesis protein [Luteimonas fraxinea]|uniref:Exopolysaccharide biosynthesis protein n=1 Tax=Luteimonas fraxinea TaxID=2901869 RepID=A0ABS8UGR7_9GAMM|nr:exopolysaccharide biosynthesis protein [Luteimonas fraxinea]MCD9097863.1 exopolysaccharide biosynthesis protein [Luteimonas fraxinea]UHH09397.1 exopolysaccharide biosynthesis protein [Luteimonas fraxinea]
MTPEIPSREEASTRELLAAMALGDPEDQLRFADLLIGLGKRVFGMMLFVATLPAFIPIPGVGGAIGGPLVALVGAQLLIGLRKPWLPRFIAERGPHRSAVQRFETVLEPWLRRVERFSRPRLPGVLDHRAAAMFTGLQLVLLGVLLALPIPFTNYVFGLLLLAYALALLERDGALMVWAWVGGIVAIGFFGVLSGTLATAATEWLARIF